MVPSLSTIISMHALPTAFESVQAPKEVPMIGSVGVTWFCLDLDDI